MTFSRSPILALAAVAGLIVARGEPTTSGCVSPPAVEVRGRAVNEERTTSLFAELRRLHDPQARLCVSTQLAQFGGGSVTVERAPVLLKDAGVAPHPNGIEVSLQGPAALLEATPAALRLPDNWEAYQTLVISFAASSEPRVVAVDAESRAATVVGTVVLPRGRIIGHARPRGDSHGQDSVIELDLADMPLASGKAELYSPLGIRLSLDEHTAARGSRHVFVVRSIELRPRTGARTPLVDLLGQRRTTSWTGKAGSVAELVRRAAIEGAELVARPPLSGRDRFGGWTQGPRFEATGFFHVKRDPAGRWWFVTPEGNPFWSVGTTGVRISSVNDTQIAKGREGLFEALPPPDHPAWFSGRQWNTLGEVEVPGNVHFYRWNVLRKYGDPAKWRDRVLDRWQAWGLNTIGAWSDDVVLDQQRVPHTRFLRARAEIPGVPAVNGFPDVWDPRWEQRVENEFAKTTSHTRDDPWLIGYFVDNEAHWSEPRLLDIGQGARLRRQWRQFAEARCGSLERFNALHGTRCGSWSEVEALTGADLPDRRTHPEAAQLMAAFEASYAERYFSTVARILKAQDPNHLYLGCRFVRVPPSAGIVAAAGRHADVISVNCYSRVPDPAAFSQWHAMSGRPILIGEFHFPLASERQLPPLWQPFPAPEREAMFVEFVRTWAGQPWSLGCHWYQHADQPLLGRHTDGENQTVGFVDVTDQPYEHLVRAAELAGREMYGWHAGL